MNVCTPPSKNLGCGSIEWTAKNLVELRNFEKQDYILAAFDHKPYVYMHQSANGRCVTMQLLVCFTAGRLYV